TCRQMFRSLFYESLWRSKMSLNPDKKSVKRSFPWFATGVAATLTLLIVPTTRQVVRTEAMMVPMLVNSIFHPNADPFESTFSKNSANVQLPSSGHADACVLRVGTVRQAAYVAGSDESLNRKPTSPGTFAKFDAAAVSCEDVPAVHAILLSHLCTGDIEL